MEGQGYGGGRRKSTDMGEEGGGSKQLMTPFMNGPLHIFLISDKTQLMSHTVSFNISKYFTVIILEK